VTHLVSNLKPERVDSKAKLMKTSKILTGLLAIVASSVITSTQAASFPSVIPLPPGWVPEGIAVGRGTSYYVGARTGDYLGAIYAGDLRSGKGGILVEPQPGKPIIGIKVDKRSNYLFAAGGPSGRADVYNAHSGALIATYQFSSGYTFINDAAITRDAVYFTDSRQSVLYKIALNPAGALASPGAFEVIPLTGFQGGFGFDANGIVATPDGSTLIVVNMNAGVLYRVDAATGDSTPIDLGGVTLVSGDGLVLSGHTLYVVRNSAAANQLAVVELDPAFEFGLVVDEIQTSAFNRPATAAEFGSSIYLVNAFGPTDSANPYTVIRVSK
jgi:hypothetical protein